MVQAKKKIALLHRYPAERIKETNAAFPYLVSRGIDVLTFKSFDRLGSFSKFWKSFLWIFYAPLLVCGKGYDVIYCDDSYPFYPIFVKLASPKSKVVLRIGDFHLMYYYSGVVYWLLNTLNMWGWHLADKILVISDVMKKYVQFEYYYFCSAIGEGWPRENPKVITVLDPVDPKDFPLNGVKSEGSVMFHGVLTKNKGVDILIHAARRLPDVKFVIIGDGPDKFRLQCMAPPNVTFKGWIPFKSMCRHIESCSVGVALRSENRGNDFVVTSPFLQYGIMGKPCLVTRRKVFGDYPWQFSGVDELVAGIKWLLKKPEEGEKLKKYILENHDAENIAEQIWWILNDELIKA